MKIALYVPAWPPGSSANGIVTYASQLVPALRQLRHEVFVLTSNVKTDVTDPYTIDVARIPLHFHFWDRVLSRISRQRIPFEPVVEQIMTAIATLKADHNLDVLEIEESFGWSKKISEAGILPIVVRLHGPWFLNGRFDNPLEFPRRIRREGSAIRAATLITAPSSDVLSAVRKRYNLELSAAQVIPNPINASDELNAWRLDKCDKNRILFVGRFDRRKGADIVARAFASLIEIYPSLRLTFVGPDDGIDEGGARLRYDEFVGKYLPASCRSRIDFYGQLNSRDVLSLRTKHLITVVASQFEILPYSVLEAMSLGCPIIASRVGGIPELITHHKNGLLFESLDVQGLYSACRKLLDNHALAASLGAQARKDCIARLNSLHIASETVSAYQAAIKLYSGAKPRSPR